MYENEVSDRATQAQANRGNIVGETLGKAEYYAKAAQDRASVVSAAQQIRQSEIDREIQRLLATTEKLEGLVNYAVKSVDKVTRAEPENQKGTGAGESPIPATVLGRDLDNINGRIQASMNLLQSTTQRIEL